MPLHDTFWIIPPIQDTISSYLDRNDHHACILVSKHLYEAFVPFLWRHVDLKSKTDFLLWSASTAQKRYQHHVKTFSLNILLADDWLSLLKKQGPAPALTSLTLCYGNSPKLVMTTTALLEAVAQHSKLERLELVYNTWAFGFYETFVDSMAVLTSLRRLKLTLERDLMIRDLAMVLNACRNVELLSLYCECSPDLVEEGVLLMELPVTRIKDLDFQPRGDMDCTILALFLRFCPQLSRLRLSKELRLTEAGSKRLGDAITSYCPLLEALDLGVSNSWNRTSVLVGCPPLKQVTVTRVSQDADELLSTLVCDHGSTLEHLDLTDGTIWTMEHLLQVAKACPNLQSLGMRVYWPSTSAWNDIPMRELVDDDDWVCTGIKALKIIFVKWDDGSDLWSEDDGYEPRSDHSNPGSENGVNEQGELNPMVMAFYRQMTRMRNLRELNLRTADFITDFKNSFVSCLDQLSVLKDLCRISFQSGDASQFSAEEQDQILGHWPRLIFFSGRIENCAQVTGEINVLPLIVDRRTRPIQYSALVFVGSKPAECGTV